MRTSRSFAFTGWLSLTFTSATKPPTFGSTGMMWPSTWASSVVTWVRPHHHFQPSQSASATTTAANTRRGRFALRAAASAIADFQDFDLAQAHRALEAHHVAFARLHQRARQRRDPADAALRGVRLVDADDLVGGLALLQALDGHRGAEE